jgi:hypothetical protein
VPLGLGPKQGVPAGTVPHDGKESGFLGLKRPLKVKIPRMIAMMAINGIRNPPLKEYPPTIRFESPLRAA